MMHQFKPVAAAIAANHCAALRGRSTTRAGLLGLFTRVGERLAATFEQELAVFCHTPHLPRSMRAAVRSLGVETIAEGDLAQRIGPLAANAVCAIASGRHRLLVSLDALAVLAQLDRTFGGTGDVDPALPAALSMSADLLAAEFEQFMLARFGETLPRDCKLQSIERNGRYALLAPFAADCELAVLTLEIDQCETRSQAPSEARSGDRPVSPWLVRFACPVAGLADLLDRRRSANRNTVARPPAGPLDPPFADMPLTLEARLVDMTVRLSALARLEPGATLPIAVARTVPLRAGQAIIARGTLGECDDKVALKITQTSFSGD